MGTQLCFPFLCSREPAARPGDGATPAPVLSFPVTSPFSQKELERRLLRLIDRAFPNAPTGPRRSTFVHVSEIGGEGEDRHEAKRAA